MPEISTMLDQVKSLVKSLHEKIDAIDQQVKNGGLMDDVLGCLDDEDGEGEGGEGVREVVGEEFVEVWAGEVARSWEDSVGFLGKAGRRFEGWV